MSSEEWSPMIGLGRACITLLWKCAICLIGWAVVAWLIAPPLAWISQTLTLSLVAVAGMIIMVGFIMLIPGAAIGSVLSGNLNERAGFDGPVLAAIASLFAWIATMGGTALGLLLRPGGSWLLTIASLIVGAVAMLLIIKNTWLDPD
ncbi:MAG: hypothetical protein JSV91_06290 [Phycisphaerales bacterium]|nr:MAG: hypothetical protein JSV91_06290 [Phycisphaerales bacterium]